MSQGTLTTKGFFPKDIAANLIRLGLAKKVNLSEKTALQLQKLAKRHPALAIPVELELAERMTRVKRASELRIAIDNLKKEA